MIDRRQHITFNRIIQKAFWNLCTQDTSVQTRWNLNSLKYERFLKKTLLFIYWIKHCHISLGENVINWPPFGASENLSVSLSVSLCVSVSVSLTLSVCLSVSVSLHIIMAHTHTHVKVKNFTHTLSESRLDGSAPQVDGVVPKGLLTFLGFLGNAEFSPWSSMNSGSHKFFWWFCLEKKLFVLSPFGWWRMNSILNNRIIFNG